MLGDNALVPIQNQFPFSMEDFTSTGPLTMINFPCWNAKRKHRQKKSPPPRTYTVVQFTFPGQKLLIAYTTRHRWAFFSSLIPFPSGLLILDRIHVISIVVPDRSVLPGHDMAFVVVPSAWIWKAYAAGHLGRTSTATDGNKKNHLLTVELDVLWNLDMGDPDYNHVGVHLNSAKLVVIVVAAVEH
ncbi:concanavalin A-like lectin protein kinase family protein [Striga asiatica]|uniref:Concanavalin A-like lectin protein kinase family protein n=1 Tax=Striga asiatica TaxID=4170 RepID=A0A5A7PXF8_STRAF|nr:concanavalin A-like lectin protein kinase family protein [Striga asiatica]